MGEPLPLSGGFSPESGFFFRSTPHLNGGPNEVCALPWSVDGTEIRLFDPRREPRDWTDLLCPTGCAVFLKDRETGGALTPEGRPYLNAADTTCIVFESVDAAQRYCESKVQALPHLLCEIYDAQGLAHPPLLAIVHPGHQSKDDSGSHGSRRRILICVALALASAPLFWVGVRQGSDLAIFLAINCLFLALRFVYWDFGVKQREKESRRRLEEHRKMERGDA